MRQLFLTLALLLTACGVGQYGGTIDTPDGRHYHGSVNVAEVGGTPTAAPATVPVAPTGTFPPTPTDVPPTPTPDPTATPAPQATATPVPPTPAPPTSFLETFEIDPSAPAAYSPPGWDVAIHSRDAATWQALDPMEAYHGADCSGPPNQHHLDGDYPSHVFGCKTHIMTSINAGGYGLITLAPPSMADFSGGETIIRWDMSTLRTSGRDWIDVWVTPWADYLQLPFADGAVDLRGYPKNSVTITMNTSGGKTRFNSSATRNGVIAGIPSNCCQFYENFLIPDAARRDTFELRLSRTHARFAMPGYGLAGVGKVFIDATIADLGFDSGVVQFGHHSYNPHKACTDAGLPADQCQPNTWHWDNVSINPSKPFEITRLSPRFVNDGGALTFPEPALPGSMLSFSAVGKVTLTFDGGSPQVVAPQAGCLGVVGCPTGHTDHFGSYFVPIPEGVTGVTVGLSTDPVGPYPGPFGSKDFAVWRR